MSDSKQIMVTIAHVRQAGLCSRGMRTWFERYKLDLMEFLTRGLPVEKIEALNDVFGAKVAAIAREEAEGQP